MNIPRAVLVNKSGMGDRNVYREIFAEKMPEWKAKFAGMVLEIVEMIS
jgi:hypothetical protein